MSEKLTSENLERIVEFVIKYDAFEIGCAYAISHLFEEDLKSIKKSHSTINSIKSEIEKAEETYNYNRAAILVHVLVSATPQHTIPNIVKMLKGISARKLFLKFPQLKKKLWGGHLWNPSYFVSTVSENTEAQVKKYIENQNAESV
jgi:putative transposase